MIPGIEEKLKSRISILTTITSGLTRKKNDYLAFFILLAFGMVAWINVDTFIWRDDWTYLSYFYQRRFQLFNGNLAFEIKPLFHYVLFFEFYLFANHFWLFQSINVLLMITISLFFYKINRQFKIDSRIALVVSILLLLHPTNFVNLFWIFQQCELLHLACLFVCLYFFLQYIDLHSYTTMAIFIALLFFQNYFFPNGLFYPIFFVLLLVAWKNKLENHLLLFFATTGVFSVHALHAFYLQSKMNTVEGLFSNFFEKLLYFLKLSTNSVLRIVIPNFQPISSPLFNALIIASISAFLFWNHKKLSSQSQKLVLLAVLGILFASITLVLTRFKQPEIHYYYTSLFIPFYLLIFAVYANHFFRFNRFTKIFAFFMIITSLILDSKAKMIFSTRNHANYLQMEKAIKTKRYEPFDDPFFLPNNSQKYISIGEYHESEAAVVLYNWLSCQKIACE